MQMGSVDLTRLIFRYSVARKGKNFEVVRGKNDSLIPFLLLFWN